MLFNKKISVYVILYYDLDFLHDILSKIYNYVDEIIIVDGPYKYSLNILNDVNLLYNQNNKPNELQKILNDYSSKIKYFYNVWKDEKEKRMFGYHACQNEIVLLVDGDEFFVFDFNFVSAFFESNKLVGGFNTYNMNRIDLTFNKEIIQPKKFVIFKKSEISAFQHLSYLWLVGVEDLEEKNINSMYLDNSLGYIYHLTLNRTKSNNIIKYIFYKSLYFYNRKEEPKLLAHINIPKLIENIGLENVLNIFYHSELHLIGIPYHEKLVKVQQQFLDLEKYSMNHFDGYLNETYTGYKNIDAFFYLDINKNIINITFDNVKKINVSLYQIEIDKEYNIQEKKELDIHTNNIFLNFDLINTEKICNVILIHCLETINGDDIYKILSIQ